MCFLLLACLLLQDPQVTVHGLGPDERAYPVQARVQPSAEANVVRKRLIDATSGAPVAGAAIEAWSEEYRRLGALVAETRTGGDGSFTLRLDRGGRHADKVRMRASGYRSTTWADSHLLGDEEHVFAYPLGEPLELRALDLAGAPIAGATVVTHQTCYHDPPATMGTSDELGRIVLRDLPAFLEHGELTLLAPGHGALGAVSPRRLLALPGHEDAGDVFVPRRRPLRLRLLDRDRGAPLADRRIVLGSSPEWQAGWTDDAGRVTFDSLFLDRDADLWLGDGPEGEWFAGVRVPAAAANREVVVRPMRAMRTTAREGGSEADVHATLEVRALERPATFVDSQVRVLHEDGWVVRGLGPHSLPPGEVLVAVGQAFGGVRESLLPITLEPGEERVVDVRPRAEPLLVARMPFGGYGTLHVQAGDDGVTLELGRNESARPVHVPAGVPVTLLAERAGEVRRATREVAVDGAVVDLTVPETLVRGSIARDWDEGRVLRARLRFEVHDVQGVPVRVGSSEIDSVLWEHTDLEPAPDVVLVELPAGSPWQASFGAPGFVTRWGQGRAPEEGGATLLVPFELVRTATLEIHGTADGTHVEEDVAPGRVRRIFTCVDGRRVALELVLEGGQHRVLTLE